jgi:hypothetical protein
MQYRVSDRLNQYTVRCESGIWGMDLAVATTSGAKATVDLIITNDSSKILVPKSRLKRENRANLFWFLLVDDKLEPLRLISMRSLYSVAIPHSESELLLTAHRHDKTYPTNAVITSDIDFDKVHVIEFNLREFNEIDALWFNIHCSLSLSNVRLHRTSYRPLQCWL